MKKKTIIIIVVSILLLAVLAYFLGKLRTRQNIKNIQNKKKQNIMLSDEEYPDNINPSKILNIGSKGNEVEWLQIYLNSFHNEKIKEDSVFGHELEKALERNGFTYPISINELP